MANKILIARGTKARIETIKSTLETYEVVYATDTGELGVKKADGNIEYFANTTDIDVIVTGKQDKLVAGANITIDPTTNVISASGGGGGIDLDTLNYMVYAYDIFNRGGHQSLFANAWINPNKRTTLFDGNISLIFADGGAAFYSGDGVDELYDLLESGGVRVGECLKITVNDTVYDATSIDSVTNTGVTLRYNGNQGGMYTVTDVTNGVPFLMVLDAAALGMPFGKIIMLANENANYLKIESGFNHYYENGIIIPDGVEIVPSDSYSGSTTFGVIGEYFKSNNFPLIIPNSVIDIGDYAFYRWEANNQPLVIPNSVTSIGNNAFEDWRSNNQPLVIPNSVTNIGEDAFRGWQQVPYVEMQSTTPPTLVSANAFGLSNAPIYVPDDSVDDYKTATNWVELADRIFSINDK